MASRGITDYHKGVGEWLHAVEVYHARELGENCDTLEEYVRRKVLEKVRKFNVKPDLH